MDNITQNKSGAYLISVPLSWTQLTELIYLMERDGRDATELRKYYTKLDVYIQDANQKKRKKRKGVK